MHVTRIRLVNWMRFGSEHTIAVGPSVYAVSARRDGEPRRSNWTGKTSLLEAVRFALFGVHRHDREDGWITDGAPGGLVRIELSNGMSIERARKRGKKTTLVLQYGDGRAATGDAAAELIVETIGLSLTDFDATCWAGQKELSRLITARPSDRFELIAEWFRLDALQASAEEVANALRANALESVGLDAEAAKHEAVLDSVIRWWTEGNETPTRETLPAVIAEGIAALEKEIAVRAAVPTVQPAEVEVVREKVRAAVLLNDVRAEGRKLSEEIETHGATEAALEEAKARYEKLARVFGGAVLTAKTCAAAARDEFSGVCPVAGIACPAKDAINADRVELKRRADEAQAALDVAATAEREAKMTLDAATARDMRLRLLVQRRDGLRVEARKLMAAAEGADRERLRELETVQIEAERQAEFRGGAEHALRMARGKQAEVETALAGLAGIAEKRKAHAAERAMLTAALSIFSKQGAQRRVAEQALEEIEAEANAILREANIELVIGIRWSREGAGLATACGVCGSAFPAGASKRPCATCGAERGPKVIQKLDVTLSDRSGAAEDLAGAALQLAAAAWLRRTRGAAWAVAFLDEPFGALDESNRTAFAAHLRAMLLGRAGFEQAFVVAHHLDVLEGLPDELVIRGGPTTSSVGTRGDFLA